MEREKEGGRNIFKNSIFKCTRRQFSFAGTLFATLTVTYQSKEQSKCCPFPSQYAWELTLCPGELWTNRKKYHISLIAVCLDYFESGQRAFHFAERFIQYIQISTEYLSFWSTFKYLTAGWVYFLFKPKEDKGSHTSCRILSTEFFD